MIIEIISNRVQFKYKLELTNRYAYGIITVSKSQDPETIFYERIWPTYSERVRLISLNLLPHNNYLFIADQEYSSTTVFKISAINPKDAYRCIFERWNLSCTNLTASNFVLRLKELGFNNINFGTAIIN